jgi:hypothetical protein
MVGYSMVNPISLISQHPFISGIIIVGVFFGCKYLYDKGYFAKIGLDKKGIEEMKKNMGAMGFGNQEEEDFSQIYNMGQEEPKKKSKKSKKQDFLDFGNLGI